MERNKGDPLSGPGSANGANGGVDFAHARHEYEDVSRFASVDDLFHGMGSLLGYGSLVAIALIMDLHRKHLPFRNPDRTIVQILGHSLVIELVPTDCLPQLH